MELDPSIAVDVEAIGRIAAVPTILQIARSISDATGPGLGLGLYIAAEIAKAHRGTLEMTSSIETGTRFTFRMPVR